MGGEGQGPPGPESRRPSLAELRSSENLARSGPKGCLVADEGFGKERTGRMLNIDGTVGVERVHEPSPVSTGKMF